MSESASLPLSGLRVAEFAHTLAGAWVGQFLADFGAEVIQIEPPGGSPLRSQRGYVMWGRGKQSVVADLDEPTDRARVMDLLSTCDVVIETFRPSATARFGLGYEQLAAVNPGLVLVSITGWGTEGPLAEVPGYEHLVLARLGALHMHSALVDRDGPAYCSIPNSTYGAAQAALQGVLAALIEREGSGRGQHVESNLVQGLAMLDVWSWFVTVVGNKFPGAFVPSTMFSDEGKPNGPFVFMLLVALTRDGRWIQFSHALPHLFAPFIRALGLESVFTDPEWKGVPMFDDIDTRDAFWRLLLRSARQRTLAEWQEVFDGDPEVWGELFRRGPELLDHQQLVHDGRIALITDPVHGPTRQPSRVVTLVGESLPPLQPAAALGTAIPDAMLVSTRVDGAFGAAAPAGRLPLEGVTVIELGILFAAPFGATLLTDLGARVIKIEPVAGDPIRNMMPFPELAGVKVLQGKESISIDLTTPEGLAVVHELVHNADIVLQSFRAGAAERLQLDATTLTALNPDLVYLNAPGYGTSGPCGGRAAFAPTIAAAAGVSWRHLGPSAPETPDLTEDEVCAAAIRFASASGAGSVTADGMSAVLCASAMLLGLLGQRRGMGGRVMETSMLASMAQVMSEDCVDGPNLPVFPTVDDELLGVNALYRLYPCKSGWVFLAACSEREWTSLVAGLDRPVSLVDDGRFGDTESRRRHDQELASVLGALFADNDAEVWEQRLLPIGVGCVRVRERVIEEELQNDPFWHELGMVVDVVHPTLDDHPRLAPFMRFSRSATVAKSGCLNGQHTDLILSELGRTPDQIADLRARGVIGG